MTNISQIMKQAKEMQEKMAEVQKKVEEAEVQGSSGGNSVIVTMNGKHELKKIKIEPSLLDKNASTRISFKECLCENLLTKVS